MKVKLFWIILIICCVIYVKGNDIKEEIDEYSTFQIPFAKLLKGGNNREGNKNVWKEMTLPEKSKTQYYFNDKTVLKIKKEVNLIDIEYYLFIYKYNDQTLEYEKLPLKHIPYYNEYIAFLQGNITIVSLSRIENVNMLLIDYEPIRITSLNMETITISNNYEILEVSNEFNKHFMMFSTNILNGANVVVRLLDYAKFYKQKQINFVSDNEPLVKSISYAVESNLNTIKYVLLSVNATNPRQTTFNVTYVPYFDKIKLNSTESIWMKSDTILIAEKEGFSVDVVAKKSTLEAETLTSYYPGFYLPVVNLLSPDLDFFFMFVSADSLVIVNEIRKKDISAKEEILIDSNDKYYYLDVADPIHVHGIAIQYENVSVAEQLAIYPKKIGVYSQQYPYYQTIEVSGKDLSIYASQIYRVTFLTANNNGIIVSLKHFDAPNVVLNGTIHKLFLKANQTCKIAHVSEQPIVAIFNSLSNEEICLNCDLGDIHRMKGTSFIGYIRPDSTIFVLNDTYISIEMSSTVSVFSNSPKLVSDNHLFLLGRISRMKTPQLLKLQTNLIVDEIQTFVFSATKPLMLHSNKSDDQTVEISIPFESDVFLWIKSQNFSKISIKQKENTVAKNFNDISKFPFNIFVTSKIQMLTEVPNKIFVTFDSNGNGVNDSFVCIGDTFITQEQQIKVYNNQKYLNTKCYQFARHGILSVAETEYLTLLPFNSNQNVKIQPLKVLNLTKDEVLGPIFLTSNVTLNIQSLNYLEIFYVKVDGKIRITFDDDETISLENNSYSLETFKKFYEKTKNLQISSDVESSVIYISSSLKEEPPLYPFLWFDYFFLALVIIIFGDKLFLTHFKTIRKLKIKKE
eukprot:TRINITY_DN1581_c0_g1_i1.p1 TRINITY_DN1581_c0_g1~~TRINITY_DN1581_c0_g1_i1.p1  ORF type:complete len:853 (-),score=246.05 TRINITY_DN1581_c0_g1_i1:70-2628(-)